jgi:hypothetical protein
VKRLLPLLVLTGVLAGDLSAQAIRRLPGFQKNFIPANDDGSSDRVQLPFTINFFGRLRSSGYVNNNGNITFDAHLATFTPFGLENTQREIIAAFFGTAKTGVDGTTSTVFQELAQDIQAYVRTQMPIWRNQYPGVEEMTLAVMGCVVNGPGESKHANIGISLPGTGEAPAAPVFIDGEKVLTLRGEHIAKEFREILDDYVQRRYGNRTATAPA